MNTTMLQVPMKKELRNKAVKSAKKQGFSSLQEIIRVFLNQLAANKIQVLFTPPSLPLSAKNDKRYTQMIAEVKSGKVRTKKFSDIDKLMAYLKR